MADRGHVQCARRRAVLAYDFTGCVFFERSHSTVGGSKTLFPSDALNGESIDSRNKVIGILLPLTFAWFRVRPFRSLSPLPFSQPITSIPTSQYSFLEQGFDPYRYVHGGSSSSRLSSPTHSPVHPSPVTAPIDYMGHAFGLRLPAITLCASLAYFARLDAFPLVLPPYSASSREQSQSQSQSEAPTVDIERYNRSFRTRTVPREPTSCPDSPSTCHDLDWLRAVAGDRFISDSVRRYTPGTFTGKWRGTELVRVGCGSVLFCCSDADGTVSVQQRCFAFHDRGSGTI